MGVFNKAIPIYKLNDENKVQYISEPAPEPVYIDDIFDPLFNKDAIAYLNDKYGNRTLGILGGYAENIDNALIGQDGKWGILGSGMGILSNFGRSMDKADDFILGGVTEAVKGITGQGMENPIKNIFEKDQDYSGARLLAAMGNSMAGLAKAPELTEQDFGGLWSIPSIGIELATDPGILGGKLSKTFAAPEALNTINKAGKPIAKRSVDILQDLGKSGVKSAVGEVGQLLSNYDDFMSKVAIDITAPGLRPALSKLRNKIFATLGNSGYHDHVDYVLDNTKSSPEDTVKKKKIIYNAKHDPKFTTIIEMSDTLNKVQKAMDYNSPNAEIIKPIKLSDLDYDARVSKMKKMLEYDPDAVAKSVADTMSDREKTIQLLSDTAKREDIEKSKAIEEFEKRIKEKLGSGVKSGILNTELPDVSELLKVSEQELRQRLDNYIKENPNVSFNKEYIDKLDLSPEAISNYAISDNEATNKAVFKALGAPINETHFQHTDAPYTVSFSAFKSNSDDMKRKTIYAISTDLKRAIEPVVQDSSKTIKTTEDLYNAVHSLGIHSSALDKLLFNTSEGITADEYIKLARQASNDILAKSWQIHSINSDTDLLHRAMFIKGYKNVDKDISNIVLNFAKSNPEYAQAHTSLVTSLRDDLDYLNLGILARNGGYRNYNINAIRKINALDLDNMSISEILNAMEAYRYLNYDSIRSSLRKFTDIEQKLYPSATKTLADSLGVTVDFKTLNIVRDYINTTGTASVDEIRKIITPEVIVDNFINNFDELFQSNKIPDLTDNDWDLISKVLDKRNIEKTADLTNLTSEALLRYVEGRTAENKLIHSLTGAIRTGKGRSKLQWYIRDTYNNSMKEMEDYIDLLKYNVSDNTTAQNIIDWAEYVQNEVLPIYDRTGKNYELKISDSLNKTVGTGDDTQELISLINNKNDINNGDLYRTDYGYKSLDKNRKASDTYNLTDSLNQIIRANSESFTDYDAANYILAPLMSYYDVTSKDANRLANLDSYSKYYREILPTERAKTIKKEISDKFIPNLIKDLDGNGTPGKYDPMNTKSSLRQYIDNSPDGTLIRELYNKVVKNRKWSSNNRWAPEAKAIAEKELRGKLFKYRDAYYKLFDISSIDVLPASTPQVKIFNELCSMYGIKHSDKFATLYISELKPTSIFWFEKLKKDFPQFANDPNFRKNYMALLRRYLGDNTVDLYEMHRLKELYPSFFENVPNKELAYMPLERKFLGYVDLDEFDRLTSDPNFLQKLSVKAEWRTPFKVDSGSFVGSAILKANSSDITSAQVKNAYSKMTPDKAAEHACNSLSDEEFTNLLSSPNLSIQLMLQENISDAVYNSVLDSLEENASKPVAENVTKKPYKGLQISSKDVPIQQKFQIKDKKKQFSPPPPPNPDDSVDEIINGSERYTLFKEITDAQATVINNKTKNKFMYRHNYEDVAKASEFMGISQAEVDSASKYLNSYIKYMDKLAGDTVKGSQIISELLNSGGKLITSVKTNELPKYNKLITSLSDTVKSINLTANTELVTLVRQNFSDGYTTLGIAVNTKLPNAKIAWKKSSKKLIKLQESLGDIVFSEPIKDVALETDVMAETGRFDKANSLFSDIREHSKEYLIRSGFKGDLSDKYVTHAFTDSEEAGTFLGKNVYGTLNAKDCEDLASVISVMDEFRPMTRGALGTTFTGRSLRGGIEAYNRAVPVFSTDARYIVRSTYTKGIMANSKMQTFMDVFNNKNFKLQTYFNSPEEVEDMLFAGGTTGNYDNFTLATPKYNDDGRLVGIHRYDKSTREGIMQALKDPDTIFIPTNVIAPLDSALKKELQMSNKMFNVLSKMTLPFKFGILANPGFLLGNAGDAYLKQATTMAQKYNTSVPEELVKVASSLRQVHELNNDFDNAYRQYLMDLKNAGFTLTVDDNISTNIVNNTKARQRFLNYMDGSVENASKKTIAMCSLTQKQIDKCRLWLYINTHQATKTASENLLDAGDLIDASNKSKFDMPTNIGERIAYGNGKYTAKDITTWGLFLNNPVSSTIIRASETMEAYFRAAAVLNDLKHHGITTKHISELLSKRRLFGTEEDLLENLIDADKKLYKELEVHMQDAINVMNHSNFSYEDRTDFIHKCSFAMPFPTFFLKNFGYWMEKLLENPQYIKRAVKVQNALWEGKDTTEDSFIAEAKGRGAIPLKAMENTRLQNLFKGIYKPTPLSSMFSAFSFLNNPIEDVYQRLNPKITSALQSTPGINLATSKLIPDDSVRYRPYSTNVFEPNINRSNPKFNNMAYAIHRSNPYERTINTMLRTPTKIKNGNAQLSDFLPSVFQPDFSKKSNK